MGEDREATIGARDAERMCEQQSSNMIKLKLQVCTE